MKKILLAAFILTATTPIFAQWPWQWERIDGNGKLVKEKREAGGYSAISSSGAWDVMVAYGESNSIEVEGDENLLPYISTKVEEGKLVIKTTKNVNLRSKNKITIYVSLTKLTGISLSGSGSVMGNGKFSNEGSTDFHISGSGNIRLSFNKLDKIKVGVSGSGSLHLAGSAGSVDAHISGSGNADCSEVICDDATARVSGSGNVKLNANKSVEASISGSGNVSYRGAASDIRKHISGSGRLSKV